jgi:hypothetical protein
MLQQNSEELSCQALNGAVTTMDSKAFENIIFFEVKLSRSVILRGNIHPSWHPLRASSLHLILYSIL